MKIERLYKFISSLLAVGFFSLGFFSCIKEDMDDCPTDIRVYFDYLPATYATIKEGINPEQVTRMNLYWFDAETNLLLGEVVDENPELSSDYYITIPTLQAGEYKFIAWGNLKDCYTLLPETPVIGTTTFDQLAVNLNSIEEDCVKTKIAPLFFGKSGIIELKQGVFSKEVRIPLMQDTYTFNLKVNGQLSANNSYKIVISDSNTLLDFENFYVACPSVNYISECSFSQKNTITGSLTTMKVDRGRSPILKVINQRDEATPVFEADLIDLILKLETQHKIEIDFSQMYEFDIEITIDNGSFAISINGWKIIYDESQLFD